MTSELRKKIKHLQGQWFVLIDEKDSRKGVREIQVPDRDWRYGEQFIGQWDAYDEVLDVMDAMTCASCKHWGREMELSGREPLPDGTRACDRLAYSMIPGIEGDVGWFRCGPDFFCAAWAAREHSSEGEND